MNYFCDSRYQADSFIESGIARLANDNADIAARELTPDKLAEGIPLELFVENEDGASE